MKKINVLSLFGWIECWRVAIDRLWWEIENYFSSEIDPYAIKQTKINYPDIIHIGSVTWLKYEEGALFYNQDNDPIKNWGSHVTTIDLVIGWSPCQDLSTAKANWKWLQGEKSVLFFEFLRIIHEVKPKYFVLENVASMKKADRAEITRLMWVEPILINSSLVSAQNRKRLYWTNIPWVTQPDDKWILLKDILEDIQQNDERWKPLDEKYLNDKTKLLLREKAYSLTATYPGACPRDYIKKSSRQLVVWQFRRTDLRIHSEQEKTCTLTANMWTGGNNVPILIEGKSQTILASYWKWAYPKNLWTNRERTLILWMAHRNRWEWKMPEINGTEKANSLTTVQSDSEVMQATENNYFWRKLTPIECERLQTLPDNFTKDLSNSRRYKAIWNGWTVDVISHILSFITF